MTRSFRTAGAAIAAGLALVLTIPVAVSAGLPDSWLPLVAVVAFTTAFTANDWIVRDRRLEPSAFLRRAITHNLVVVALVAVVVTIVVPSPDRDDGRTGGGSGGSIAPPPEDARPSD